MGALQDIIIRLAELYSVAIIIYILMSWFPGSRDSSIGRFLAGIVEPYLEPFRSIIPPIGMIDISALVAIITLRLAMSGLHVLFGMF
ncbi:YggT family protein [Natronobacillus azotifigens]|uniref:YggT family protein n=1 Tax=Natronobacillus azotifigens TaxID=472978 RepID=A0A9J6RCC9_9BACI|nr:YggT family protein [Natronobacillus azotifigens]MCZ0703352.1 YggT family protein [Natronobacillus azotifigens]